jgi:hypothetical protein
MSKIFIKSFNAVLDDKIKQISLTGKIYLLPFNTNSFIVMRSGNKWQTVEKLKDFQNSYNTNKNAGILQDFLKSTNK